MQSTNNLYFVHVHAPRPTKQLKYLHKSFFLILKLKTTKNLFLNK